MDERRIRQIVREELQKAGVLSEVAKKGSNVDTPHGPGEVLTVIAGHARVRLGSGAIVKVPVGRCVVRG